MAELVFKGMSKIGIALQAHQCSYLRGLALM